MRTHTGPGFYTGEGLEQKVLESFRGEARKGGGVLPWWGCPTWWDVVLMLGFLFAASKNEFSKHPR